MNPDAARLITIFSASGWQRFVATLKRYRDRGKPLPAAFALPNATDDERRSCARLLRLRQPPAGSTLRYDLKRIAEALAMQDIHADWPALLESLCGPVPAEVIISQENRRAWDKFWPLASALAAEQLFPLSAEWLQSIRRDGSLVRLSKGDASLALERLRMACAVLAALPLADEPLPGAAARLCGNSHALDSDSPLSALILRSLAMQRSMPVPDRSDDRRRLWEQFGVICDDLSAPVLTLNLRLSGPSLLCRLVAEASEEGQPLHLTNRLIASSDWSQITCPPNVFICENPTILALAACRLGPSCPPMVCVNGEPRSTSRSLLRWLRERGATLGYHGDFDWPGIAIAARLFCELGAQPWLFSDVDYEDAVRAGRYRLLSGAPVETPWNPPLSRAMKLHAKAVDEEAVADLLMGSLQAAGGPARTD